MVLLVFIAICVHFKAIIFFCVDFSNIVNSEDIQIRIGSSFHNRGGQIYFIDSKRKHSEFSSNLDADIAVLKLTESLTLSYRVAVVKLPEQDDILYRSCFYAKVTYFEDDKVRLME